MNRNELNRAVIFVAHGGGSIICEDAKGNSLWERGFAPGRYQAKDLIQDIPEGFTLRAGQGASILVPPLKTQRASYGEDALKSGANPDFRPSRMTDQELQMRKLMTEVSKNNSAMKRRLAALEANQARVPDPLPYPLPEKDEGAAGEVEVDPSAEIQGEVQ